MSIVFNYSDWKKMQKKSEISREPIFLKLKEMIPVISS